MRRIALAATLALVATACASGPRLAPKAGPDEVRVFYANNAPEPQAGYKVIGPVRLERPLSTNDADVVLGMRAIAARMGADAIIVQRIGRTTEGAATSSRDEMKIGEALAVYWPASE